MEHAVRRRFTHTWETRRKTSWDVLGIEEWEQESWERKEVRGWEIE